MASDENHALTEAERREIAEYKRIVAFSQQVLAGTHPRVKIPHRLRPQLNFFPLPKKTFNESPIVPTSMVRYDRQPISQLLQPKSAKEAVAPTPRQQQPRTMTYPIDWQHSSSLARKRKYDEMEDTKRYTQAQEWSELAEDGDSVRAWEGDVEDPKRKTQAEEWEELAEDGDDLRVWVGV